MRRIIMTVAVFLSLVALVVGCAKPAVEPTPTPTPTPTIPMTRLTFAATSAGSSHFANDVAQCEVMSRHPQIEVLCQEVGGVSKCQAMIAEGTCDLGQNMFSDMKRGMLGTFEYEKSGPILKDLRVMLVTHGTQHCDTVLSSIKNFQDLQGKPVILLAGSGGQMVEFFLDANGIVPSSKEFSNDTDIIVERLKRGDAVGFLGKGGLKDAMILRIITEVEGTHILPVPKEMLDKTNEKYPGALGYGTVPGGNYPGHPNDIPTYSHHCGEVCRKDLSEQIVYEMLKLLYENRVYLASTFEPALGIQDDFPRMTLEINAVYKLPLHAGAVKLDRELGLKVPEDQLPPEMK